MALKSLSFATADALVAYVANELIEQDNVECIFPHDGRWWLFWWA